MIEISIYNVVSFLYLDVSRCIVRCDLAGRDDHGPDCWMELEPVEEVNVGYGCGDREQRVGPHDLGLVHLPLVLRRRCAVLPYTCSRSPVNAECLVHIMTY